MSGIFSKSARPVRPGAYFDFASQPQETVLPNIGQIVAVPFTHDWGPANTPVLCTSFADFQQKFGPTTNTTGYLAAKTAFKGEGLQGRGGAGALLAYRLVGSAGAAGTIVLNNTSAAAAVTLTAKYLGTYAANLSVTTGVTDPVDGTKKDLIINLNGQPVETYAYTATDITGLAAQINASSQWVTAGSVTTGTALATVSGSALTGANSGTATIAGDWTTMQNALGTQRFSFFAPYDIAASTGWSDGTGNAIFTSLVAWTISLNQGGRRFISVFGGSAGDTSTTAVARSALAANENVINVGASTVVDAELGAMTSSQLAPRIAGMLAARGEEHSLTFARLAGTVAGTLPTQTSILQAFNGGVVVLAQDSNPNSPIRVEKGLTTYIGGDTNRPYLIYRNPKFVRTMQGIDTDITSLQETNAVGELQVNAQARTYVVGLAKQLLKGRADRGVIGNSYSVTIDPNPPPQDTDEFIALVYGVTFGRSVEQVFNLVYVS